MRGVIELSSLFLSFLSRKKFQNLGNDIWFLESFTFCQWSCLKVNSSVECTFHSTLFYAIPFLSTENTYSIENTDGGLGGNHLAKEPAELPANFLAVRPKGWESPLGSPCTILRSPPSLEWPLVLAGMGDMAVSNSIGSNVFDILIGLGLPWALQTLAVDYGSYVSGFSLWFLFKSWAMRNCFHGKGDAETLMLRGKQSLPHLSPSKIRLK